MENSGVLILNWIDYYTYYFYLYYDRFLEYPWVIRFSVFIILSLICVWIYLWTYILIARLKSTYRSFRHQKLVALYYKKMILIATQNEKLTSDQISKALALKKRRLITEDKRYIVFLLVRLKEENETINQYNLHQMVIAFGLPHFFEHEIRYGKAYRVIRLLKSLQSINETVGESVLSSMLYHRKWELRKATRIAYMWLSQNDPFRFLDEDIDTHFSEYDKLEMHNIFLQRKNQGNLIPNFLPWVIRTQNDELRTFLIGEIRYFEQTENCEYLIPLLDTDNLKLRKEIIQTLCELKYTAIEQRLVDEYPTQPEVIKQSILSGLLHIKEKNRTPFLKQAFSSANDIETKRIALKVLFNYSEDGRRIFGQMAHKANYLDQNIFTDVYYTYSQSAV
ncbi:hypothetical protein [Parabacteroides sp. FAFU027]|uniref:hypothetical protein n=1 Tax=Parabacteroides sp. FAFU027 TaxID=2922715 RepID=UPI001FAF4652|nr:hypothetical protein [Parabacteroides sp. FAFU027]